MGANIRKKNELCKCIDARKYHFQETDAANKKLSICIIPLICLPLINLFNILRKLFKITTI